MEPLEAVIIIPAYKPENKLIQLTQALREIGFGRIVVADDGSGAEYAGIFHQA